MNPGERAQLQANVAHKAANVLRALADTTNEELAQAEIRACARTLTTRAEAYQELAENYACFATEHMVD